MKIKTSNLFVKFYVWLHNDLPVDFCTLFWGVVFGFFLSPILIPGRLMEGKDRFGRKFKAGIAFYAIWAFVMLLGTAVKWDFGIENTILWILLKTLYGSLIVAAFVSLILLGVYTAEKWPSRSWMPTLPSFPVKDAIAGIRGKYCTKIEWLD